RPPSPPLRRRAGRRLLGAPAARAARAPRRPPRQPLGSAPRARAHPIRRTGRAPAPRRATAAPRTSRPRARGLWWDAHHGRAGWTAAAPASVRRRSSPDAVARRLGPGGAPEVQESRLQGHPAAPLVPLEAVERVVRLPPERVGREAIPDAEADRIQPAGSSGERRLQVPLPDLAGALDAQRFRAEQRARIADPVRPEVLEPAHELQIDLGRVERQVRSETRA